MKKGILKGMSLALAVILTLRFLPFESTLKTVSAEDSYDEEEYAEVLFDDDFSEYTKGVDWIVNSETQSSNTSFNLDPSVREPAVDKNWRIGRHASSTLNQLPISGDDVSVMVVDEETEGSEICDSEHEKALRISTSSVNKYVTSNNLSLTTNPKGSRSAIPLKDGCKLYISGEIFIPEDQKENCDVSDYVSVFGIKGSNESNGYSYSVWKTTDFSTGGRQFSIGMGYWKTREEQLPFEDATFDDETFYNKVSGSANDPWIKTEKWVKLEYVVDTTSTEKYMTYRAYADGVPIQLRKQCKESGRVVYTPVYDLYGKGAGISATTGNSHRTEYDRLTQFNGIELAPIAVNGKTFTYYVDNVKAVYVKNFVPVMTADNVYAEDEIALVFPDAVSDEDLSLIASGIKVTDEDENEVPIIVKAENNKIFVSAKDGWVYGNKQYKVTISDAEVYDSYRQRFSGFAQSFKTRRAPGVFISDDAAMNVADGKASFDIKLQNPNNTSEKIVVGALIYGEGEKLLGKAFETVSNTAETIPLILTAAISSEDVKYAHICLWRQEADGRLGYTYDAPLKINPSGYKAETAAGGSEAFDIKITDAANAVLKVSDKTALTGENNYATILILSDEKNSADYADAAAICVVPIKTDGSYIKEFAFGGGTDKYAVFGITKAGTQKKLFPYASMEDVCNAIGQINNNMIAKDNIYTHIIAYNDGIGLDSAIYESERNKKIFNKRMDESRASLKGGNAKEILAAFMSVAKEVENEIKFLDDLKNNVNYWTDRKAILESNVKYNKINFARFNELSDESKKSVIDSMSGIDFEDADAVKAYFDNAVESKSNGTAPSSPSSSRPGGGGRTGGGGGGSGVVIGAINETDKTVNINASAASFEDLEEYEWAKEAVELLVNRKIVSGVSESSFAPQDAVTREQFVKMIVLYAGKYSRTEKCNFSDVAPDAWYYSYVASAVKAGLINGISEDEFGTGQPISRQDMAVVIQRIAKLEISEDIAFADGDKIRDYAKEAVAALAENKIILGDEDGRFRAEDSVTRAEAAVVICRLIKLMEGI